MATNKQTRQMPHDIVAESAVLGCMLINNNSVSKAIQILEPNSFYDPKNKIIFENMVSLFNENKAQLIIGNVDLVGTAFDNI